jgi:hypothetical protein
MDDSACFSCSSAKPQFTSAAAIAAAEAASAAAAQEAMASQVLAVKEEEQRRKSAIEAKRAASAHKSYVSEEIDDLFDDLDDAPAEDGKWACKFCKCDNEAGDSECGACGSTRPHSGGAAASAFVEEDVDESDHDSDDDVLYDDAKAQVDEAPPGFAMAAAVPPQGAVGGGMAFDEMAAIMAVVDAADTLFWACDFCKAENAKEDPQCYECGAGKDGSEPTKIDDPLLGITDSGFEPGFAATEPGFEPGSEPGALEAVTRGGDVPAWSCSLCTLENDGGKGECQACGTKKLDEFDSSAAAEGGGGGGAPGHSGYGAVRSQSDVLAAYDDDVDELFAE